MPPAKDNDVICKELGGPHRVARRCRLLFQREYHDSGKDLRTMNKPIPVDGGWLREQTEVHQRSASDIAAELGLTPETVRRNLIRFNIAGRPQRIAGMPSHSRTYPTSQATSVALSKAPPRLGVSLIAVSPRFVVPTPRIARAQAPPDQPDPRSAYRREDPAPTSGRS